MLRKIIKGICCVSLWCSLVFIWIDTFETWPLFNQVTNTTIVLILSLIFAVVSCYGIISIIKWVWERNR